MDNKIEIFDSSKFNNTGYWIFFCNPKLWQIDEFLETGEIHSTWKITELQKNFFKKGQKALIRVGIDLRTKAELGGKDRLKPGIYGIVEITSEAINISDSDEQFWLKQDSKNIDNKFRVRIKYLENLLDNPILLSDIKHSELFKDENTLLNGRQASSWSIKKETFINLLEIAKIKINILSEISNTELNNILDLKKLEAKYFNATPRIKEIISRRIERGVISKVAKKANNYECQICKALSISPFGFMKPNGENYIETHHIIPVSELEQGSLGTLNLLTVCANHHRQLHYGNFKIINNCNDFIEFLLDGKKLLIKKPNYDSLAKHVSNLI
jgi:predicted HNH restriction endonuclease